MEEEGEDVPGGYLPENPVANLPFPANPPAMHQPSKSSVSNGRLPILALTAFFHPCTISISRLVDQVHHQWGGGESLLRYVPDDMPHQKQDPKALAGWYNAVHASYNECLTHSWSFTP